MMIKIKKLLNSKNLLLCLNPRYIFREGKFFYCFEPSLYI